jgi:SAM-dependent methyltransferase
MQIHQCRVCQSNQLERILDLGRTALANRFLKPEALKEPEPFFPLRVVLCGDCGLVQLDEEVPRETLFKDYIYASGTSSLVWAHARWLAQHLCRRYGLGAQDLVIEAASNDGTVLKEFRWQGTPVLGIEPAENIAAAAIERGIPTVVDFFDERLARRIREEYGSARLFLARHVLAHVSDLHGFVRGIKHLLAEDGVAMIEVPHLAELFLHLEFDTIYHEHLCYFSAAVLRTLMAKFGLSIFDVDRVAIHGGSLLIHVGHEGAFPVSPKLVEVLSQEDDLRLSQPDTWRGFARRVSQVRESLPRFMDGLRNEGQSLAGYGAAAKANTLLAYCGIGPERLPFIIDRSTLKQGLFTPGHHIPVRSPDALLEEQPDVTLILPWNFADEIFGQQAEYRRRGGRMVVPIPSPRFLGSARRSGFPA